MTAALPLSYVLPMRWSSDEELPELAAYLRALAETVDVVVVDGSAQPLFSAHAQAFGPRVRHLAPDLRWACSNGKVSGVITGVHAAAHEDVVIADDDVRYDVARLERVHELLSDHDLVKPQNVFEPLPWHAKWDTARSLLNRAVARHDYPGTLGLRRSTFLAMGGYDGDVMFENLELERTVRAAGGRQVSPLDLFVVRRPCTTRHFVSQRVRQAYDDLAQPWRLVAALAVWPAVVEGVRRPAYALGGLGLVVGLAEVGRRRGGGAAVYRRTAALWAPLWVLERGTCSWAAVYARLVRGGIGYRGQRIRTAAHSTRTLRRRGKQQAPVIVRAAAPARSAP